MNIVQKTLLKDIDNCLKNTYKLIDRNKASDEVFLETDTQLQIILNDLKKMESQLLRNNIPKQEDRFVVYEYFILEWGIRHSFGQELLDVATRYTYMKNPS